MYMGIENRLKQLRVFKRIDLLPFTVHNNQTLQASAPLQNVLCILCLSTAVATVCTGMHVMPLGI